MLDSIGSEVRGAMMASLGSGDGTRMWTSDGLDSGGNPGGGTGLLETMVDAPARAGRRDPGDDGGGPGGHGSGQGRRRRRRDI